MRHHFVYLIAIVLSLSLVTDPAIGIGFSSLPPAAATRFEAFLFAEQAMAMPAVSNREPSVLARFSRASRYFFGLAAALPVWAYKPEQLIQHTKSIFTDPAETVLTLHKLDLYDVIPNDGAMKIFGVHYQSNPVYTEFIKHFHESHIGNWVPQPGDLIPIQDQVYQLHVKSVGQIPDALSNVHVMYRFQIVAEWVRDIFLQPGSHATEMFAFGTSALIVWLVYRYRRAIVDHMQAAYRAGIQGLRWLFATPGRRHLLLLIGSLQAFSLAMKIVELGNTTGFVIPESSIWVSAVSIFLAVGAWLALKAPRAPDYKPNENPFSWKWSAWQERFSNIKMWWKEWSAKHPYVVLPAKVSLAIIALLSMFRVSQECSAFLICGWFISAATPAIREPIGKRFHDRFPVIETEKAWQALIGRDYSTIPDLIEHVESFESEYFKTINSSAVPGAKAWRRYRAHLGAILTEHLTDPSLIPARQEFLLRTSNVQRLKRGEFRIMPRGVDSGIDMSLSLKQQVSLLWDIGLGFMPIHPEKVKQSLLWQWVPVRIRAWVTISIIVAVSWSAASLFAPLKVLAFQLKSPIPYAFFQKALPKTPDPDARSVQSEVLKWSMDFESAPPTLKADLARKFESLYLQDRTRLGLGMDTLLESGLTDPAVRTATWDILLRLREYDPDTVNKYLVKYFDLWADSGDSNRIYPAYQMILLFLKTKDEADFVRTTMMRKFSDGRYTFEKQLWDDLFAFLSTVGSSSDETSISNQLERLAYKIPLFLESLKDPKTPKRPDGLEEFIETERLMSDLIKPYLLQGKIPVASRVDLGNKLSSIFFRSLPVPQQSPSIAPPNRPNQTIPRPKRSSRFRPICLDVV